MPRDFLPAFNVAANLQFAKGVLLLEDCEGTFTWDVEATGGDDVHAFAGVAALMGTNGMQLKTRTTAAAAGDFLQVGKRLGFPESGLLVIRARLAFLDVTKVDFLWLGVTVADGASKYQAQLRVTPAVPSVKYLDSADNLVVLAALGYLADDLHFMNIELVLDVLRMEYVEASWAGARVEMPGTGMFLLAASALRQVRLLLYFRTVQAAAAEVYVDSVYVGEFLSA